MGIQLNSGMSINGGLLFVDSVTMNWDQATDTYIPSPAVNNTINVQKNMKRCVLNLNGTVNYYLDPNDSTKKLDGSPANLDGSDGYVMVEIPKFSFNYHKVGSTYTWYIADGNVPGFTVHPAFIKNGVEVDYRYMGAYDACFWDATDGVYKSGLNLDNSSSLFNTSEDKLASVAGVYPLVGMTRNESRLMANNNGSGWRQQDFWLTSAVQLLYLIEYGTFNSQLTLGSGNTNGSYLESSSNQNDSPHTIAGASNSWGNDSTNGTQPSAGDKPGTAYMSYRGIENFFGNCWNWVDGFNMLTDYQAWVTNDQQFFVDNVSTGMTFLGTLGNTNGWVTDILDFGGTFLPTQIGGSSTTRLCDFYFTATGNRVAPFGGNASSGARAGAFYWFLLNASGGRNRNFGARVCY
jgi:hypothetical protein